MSSRNVSRGRSAVPKAPIINDDSVLSNPKRRRTSIAAPTTSQPVTPLESDRDAQIPDIISKFNAVEKALNNFNQKKRVSDWTLVKDAAGRFFRAEILLSDIDVIMEIYPEAYSFIWRTSGVDRKRFELVINLPSESRGKFETRSNAFRDSLDEWCSRNPGDNAVVASRNYIPDMPLKIDDVPVPSSTASIIAIVAADQKTALSSYKGPISGSEGLKYLREQAVLRDENKDIRAAEQLKEKNILDLKNRMLSLPTLCDALRSRCLADNRTCLKTSELMRILISELYLTKQELSQRLNILSDIIPEFITLIPADNIVPVSTVRLNLQAPYGVVRKKVISYIASVSDNI